MDPVSFRDWEGCAEQLRAEIAVDDDHVHPKLLVERCELELVDERPPTGPCFTGRRIYYDSTARPERQAGIISHELGHFAAQRYGEHDSERCASYVGAALLVARRALDRSLRSHGWNLELIRPDFQHASPELLARRIADVREAVVTITDGRRIRARVASPWLPLPRPRLTQDEQRVLRAAVESGRRVDEGWISATPYPDPVHPRVILIAEREQLELRF